MRYNTFNFFIKYQQINPLGLAEPSWRQSLWMGFDNLSVLPQLRCIHISLNIRKLILYSGSLPPRRMRESSYPTLVHKPPETTGQRPPPAWTLGQKVTSGHQDGCVPWPKSSVKITRHVTPYVLRQSLRPDPLCRIYASRPQGTCSRGFSPIGWHH